MSAVTDAQFRALANVYRRRILVSLMDHNPQAVQLGASNAPDETDDERRMIELHHIHLPKLEEYDYISWDRETQEVEKGPRFDEIEPLLAVLIENRDRLGGFTRGN